MQQATGQELREEDSTSLNCCRTLYGGLAFIAANRIAPGYIQHLSAGPIAAGIATSAIDPTTARQELEQLWQPVPTVPCQWEESLLVGRWRKMLWNLPFNGISVAMGGIPTDEIVSDPSLRALARQVMHETLAIERAECGNDNDCALPESQIEAMFTLTDSIGSYRPSTMIDLLEQRPMEVKYLFQKPVERAWALRVATPHLDTLVAMIEARQRKLGLY